MEVKREEKWRKGDVLVAFYELSKSFDQHLCSCQVFGFLAKQTTPTFLGGLGKKTQSFDFLQQLLMDSRNIPTKTKTSYRLAFCKHSSTQNFPTTFSTVEFFMSKVPMTAPSSQKGIYGTSAGSLAPRAAADCSRRDSPVLGVFVGTKHGRPKVKVQF